MGEWINRKGVDYSFGCLPKALSPHFRGRRLVRAVSRSRYLMRQQGLIQMGIVFLFTTVVGAGRGYALGDFSSVAYNFWITTIDSYWWPTRKDYRRSWDERGPHPPALLPSEVEPVGLETTTLSDYQPPDPENVSCADFRVVRFRDIDPADGSN